jgi:hypothetical protein
MMQDAQQRDAKGERLCSSLADHILVKPLEITHRAIHWCATLLNLKLYPLIVSWEKVG